MFKKLIVILLLSSILMTACSIDNRSSILPEDIVVHAIEANENIDSYYMESKITIYEDDEIIEELDMKEWFSLLDGTGRTRVESISDSGEVSISTNDGEKIIVYNEKTNSASIANITEEMANSIVANTSKKQTMNTLESIKSIHDIENLGEVELNGMEVYHLKGTPKKENSITGEQELWIDKETWAIVKLVNNGLGHKIELEVIELDISPDIDESIFLQDIPEDVEITDIDETIMEEEIATMEELTEEMEGSLLYVPESLGYDLRQIRLYRFNDNDLDDEATQEYFKDDVKKFNIFVTKQKIDASEKELLPGEEEVEIRGIKAYLLDDFIRRISFAEDGIQYTLQIEDDSMDIEEAIEIIEDMEIYR